MADKLYYWIKLRTDFFDNDTIDFIMSQENGANYVVLYQMLCLKTANTDGGLYSEMGEVLVPYDVNKIARLTKFFSTDTVRVALELYKQLGLVYSEGNGILRLTGYDSMVGHETKWAQKKRAYRKGKDISEDNVLKMSSPMSSDCPQNVLTMSADNVRQEREIRDRAREESIDIETLTQRENISKEKAEERYSNADNNVDVTSTERLRSVYGKSTESNLLHDEELDLFSGSENGTPAVHQQYTECMQDVSKMDTREEQKQEKEGAIERKGLTTKKEYTKNKEHTNTGISDSDSEIKETYSLQNISKKKESSFVSETATRAKRFVKPTEAEVQAYVNEKGYDVNVEAWYAHYESNGWKVGSNPMKDWKACVRYWTHSNYNNSKSVSSGDGINHGYNKRVDLFNNDDGEENPWK